MSIKMIQLNIKIYWLLTNCSCSSTIPLKLKMTILIALLMKFIKISYYCMESCETILYVYFIFLFAFMKLKICINN